MRKRLKPTLSRPRDFQAFWDKTLRELDAVRPDVVRAPLESGEDGDLILESVKFASLGGATIHGYHLRPRELRCRPIVVHCHGYGSVSNVQWDWARNGFEVLGFDVRGFGRSRDALPNLSRWGFVLTGIASPETCALRGAVCDFIRAAKVAAALAGAEVSRMVLYGRSFGGGLALMAEAVRPVADLLVAGVPTLGWAEGRHFFVKQGSGREVNDYLDARPDQAEDVMLVLRYFDAANLAGMVRCPTLIGVGLEDAVVPANTVYAVANHLAGPVEVMEFPVSHTDRPEEKLWDAFEDRWQRLAERDIPDDFGAGH